MPTKDIAAYVSAMQSDQKKISTDSIIIPLVIHNLTWNRVNYIPDHDFVEVVRKVNDRLANRGEFYAPLGMDTKIRVALANIDPDGNPTNGIEHVEDPRILEFGQYVNSSLYWDTDRYLNAYVYDGNLGFANYPWNGGNYIMISSVRTRLAEGIVTWVHEIGHVLGLFHTHENCASVRCLELGDMVCDTRPDQVPFQPCFDMDSCRFDNDPDDPENFLEGLNTLDMIDNYMDGGLCQARFTAGQVERMHWVMEMYKPGWDSKGSLCKDCPSFSADFDTSADHLEVGQSISFTAIEQGSFQYSWYVDTLMQSTDDQWTTSFSTPGAYTIRLDISAGEGDCKDIIWSREKVIAVRCGEEESLRIAVPDRMVVDSCYEIQIAGVSDLFWIYENIEGVSSMINICPSAAGLQEMHITYGTGGCRSAEVLHYMVYEKSERSRSYFHQSMRFESDSTSSQDFMKLYEVGEDAYRLAGVENLARQNFGEQWHQNFVRTWYPFEQEGYEWELYQDSLPVLVETDHITQLQIDYLEMVEDSLDGSTYYLGYEHYSNSRSSRFILGKLNVLGKPIWTKRIQIPEYHFYEGKSNNNKYIHFIGNDLLLNLNQILCKVDKQGQVLAAVGLDRIPDSLYDRPMNSSRLGMSVNEGKIFYTQMISVIDTTLYPEYTDSIRNIYESTIWTGVLNEDLDLESSQFYRYDTNSQLTTNTFTCRKYKKGALIFWRKAKARISFSDPLILQLHFLYVNESNVIVNYKVIEHSNGSIGTNALSMLEVLANDEQIVGLPVSRGGSLEYYRIDPEWQNVQPYGYEIFNDSVIVEGAIEGYFSGARRAERASVLTHDGILANYYTAGSSIDKNNFFLLPLDNKLLSCGGYTPSFEVLDGTLELHNLQPGVESVPTRIEMEDIYLKRRVRTFTSDVICENTYALEDYSIVLLDTICDPSGTIEIKVEVCREDRLPADTLSLDFYLESPLMQEEAPFSEQDIKFLQGQNCVQKTFFMQGKGIHILLNGDAESRRPYTLKKTFFDAHEKMEYDYTNNMAYVEVCENMVTVDQSIKEHVTLDVYPNPTSQTLNISIADGEMSSIEIYNSLGEQLYTKQFSGTASHQLNLKNWSDGLYFIKSSLKDGSLATAKFLKSGKY